MSRYTHPIKGVGANRTRRRWIDDGPVMSMTSARHDCGSHECIVLHITQDIDLWAQGKVAPGFAKRLLDAERVIVEVPIYKYGAHQYRYETKGLVWPQPGAPQQASRAAESELSFPETVKLPDVDMPRTKQRTQVNKREAKAAVQAGTLDRSCVGKRAAHDKLAS